MSTSPATISKVCTSFFLHLVTGLHNSTLLSHLYNPTKVLQMILHQSIPPQSFSTAAADHSYTMSYHSSLKKRKKLISLPFFLYCHVLDLSTFHSMARKHYLMNLETFLNLSTLNCFQRANLLRTLSLLLKVVYGGWPDIRKRFFACKDIKYQTVLNLLDNYLPLVLSIYSVVFSSITSLNITMTLLESGPCSCASKDTTMIKPFWCGYQCVHTGASITQLSLRC